MGSISNHMDRISELPDALICHILSFLRTKEAVRTSVLSTKWKKQWTRVPSLDLDWTDYPIGIERVLLFRGSSNIQKVRLCLTDQLVEFGTELNLNLDYARIDGWIRTVMWRNVVELDLTVDPAQEQQNMELPLSLFTCRTLKVLRLDSYYSWNPPTTGCFPCLKVLFIMVMVCDYDTSGLERIFCNCPALEDLTVMFNFLDGGCDINISLPELKMLDILCLGWLDENEEKYSISINAPKLVNFYLAMHHCQHLSALVFHVNANSLFKTNIQLTRMGKQYDSRIAILDTIASVKHLNLFLSSSFCFEALPDFDNLTHLELDAPLHLNCWALLIEFLKRSPNLEDLAIEHKKIGGRICDEFDLPEVVPGCMLSHLKTITFTNFKGRPDEMGLAKHLLKYSKVLKKMTVFTAYPKRANKQAIDTEFLAFERGSETCQVEIL